MDEADLDRLVKLAILGGGFGVGILFVAAVVGCAVRVFSLAAGLGAF